MTQYYIKVVYKSWVCKEPEFYAMESTTIRQAKKESNRYRNEYVYMVEILERISNSESALMGGANYRAVTYDNGCGWAASDYYTRIEE